jgi:3-isopropylmalate dehydrogenase
VSRIHRLAVLGGDGIGPEVVAEGLKVLDRLEELEGFTTERVDYDLGGRRYLDTGEVLSDETLEELRGATRSTSAPSAPPTCPPASSRRGCC